MLRKAGSAAAQRPRLGSAASTVRTDVSDLPSMESYVLTPSDVRPSRGGKQCKNVKMRLQSFVIFLSSQVLFLNSCEDLLTGPGLRF